MSTMAMTDELMEKTAFLERVSCLKKRVDGDLELMNEQKELKYGYNNLPDGHKYAESEGKSGALEERLRTDLEQYQQALCEALAAINTLNDPKREAVLRYRYVFGYTREETAGKMDLSIRTVTRLHLSALTDMKLNNPPL